VEALIAGAYLAGTNTRRVKRALAPLFKGAVGKDVVSRAWRKVHTDWDAWMKRDLAGEDIVRLVLDGTVVRVRLDRKATNISLLVVPVQRCTMHKHRNLLAHAPDGLHDEISADYTDMIYAATAAEVQQRRRAFLRKWRLRCPAVATSLEEAGERLFSFLRLPPSQWKSARTTNAIDAAYHVRLHRQAEHQAVRHVAAERQAHLLGLGFVAAQGADRGVLGQPAVEADRHLLDQEDEMVALVHNAEPGVLTILGHPLQALPPEGVGPASHRPAVVASRRPPARAHRDGRWRAGEHRGAACLRTAPGGNPTAGGGAGQGTGANRRRSDPCSEPTRSARAGTKDNPRWTAFRLRGLFTTLQTAALAIDGRLPRLFTIAPRVAWQPSGAANIRPSRRSRNGATRCARRAWSSVLPAFSIGPRLPPAELLPVAHDPGAR